MGLQDTSNALDSKSLFLRHPRLFATARETALQLPPPVIPEADASAEAVRDLAANAAIRG